MRQPVQIRECWVLLLSTHKLVETFIGDFDPDAGVFTAQASGLLDASDHFYATNLLLDDQGRTLCFGWVRGFAPGRGWSGCLSLPRVLSLDEHGCLRQTPPTEVQRFHREGFHAVNIPLGVYSAQGFQSDAMDLQAVIECGPEATFTLRLIPLEPGAQVVEFTCRAHEVCL
jgi:sucrose-6-phosphate hydrolase SacC (GH32 family)